MAQAKESYKGFHDRKTIAIRSVVGVGEWLYLIKWHVSYKGVSRPGPVRDGTQELGKRQIAWGKTGEGKRVAWGKTPGSAWERFSRFL